MERILKKALALLLVASLLCGLCGCTALEEMRKNQAFSQEDGTILWGGSIYKLLPVSDELFPEMDYETNIFLTASDVPVLLSLFYAQEYLNASEDGRFLEDSSYGLYCRADAYEEISKRVQEGFEPEIVCYFYDVFDEDNWEYTQLQYTLTAEQREVVELVASTMEPVSGSQMGVPESDYSVYLYECSADMLQQKCNSEIVLAGRQYYLKVYTEEDVLIFTVPEGCNEIFGQIMSTYISAMQNVSQADEELTV